MYERLWLAHHYPPVPDNWATRLILYLGLFCAFVGVACFTIAMTMIVVAAFAGLGGWGGS